MKFFVFAATAALLVGSIYHTEISDYVADLTNGSYSFGNGPSVLSSMQSVGAKSSAAFGKVGSAFGR